VGGCRKGAELWRRVKSHGFKGSLRVVTEWATRRRRAEKATDQQLQKVPSARIIARLMTMKRDHLTKSETVTVTAIEKGVPTLAEARLLVDRFQAMIRKKVVIELEPWIADSERSLIASFANGIVSDKSAVYAAITLPWSNGQVRSSSWIMRITTLGAISQMLSQQLTGEATRIS
jgi:transposase